MPHLLFAWQRSAVGVILCGILITICTNRLSLSFHAYQAELYPTRIRAQAVGFVYSWSRFSAIFSGFIIAFFLDRYGTLGVFGFIAGAMLVASLSFPLSGRRSRSAGWKRTLREWLHRAGAVLTRG
jgi:putative MFS transporter